MSRRKRCEGCEGEECLRCSDMVMSGERTDDHHDSHLHEAFYDDEDPMDVQDVEIRNRLRNQRDWDYVDERRVSSALGTRRRP
ncbi:MAG: hypothetical protein U9Q03_04445 [Patescibacteria group bacterium]|nr:hypothetical protein [Patescibacteria group bacterium]